MSSLRVVVASRLPWATYVFYICMLTTEIKISWVGRSTRWVLEASAFLPKINSCCFDFGDSNDPDSHTGSDSLVLPGLSVPTSVSSPDPPQFPRCFSLPATSGEPAGGWTGDEGGEKCAICLSQYLPQYLPFSLGREFQVTSKYLVCFLDRSLWPGQKIILIDWMLICHPMKTLHVFLRRKFPNFHLPPLPKNLNNKSCKV